MQFKVTVELDALDGSGRCRELVQVNASNPEAAKLVAGAQRLDRRPLALNAVEVADPMWTGDLFAGDDESDAIENEAVLTELDGWGEGVFVWVYGGADR